eukprot:Gregarina_sp_Poly_1__7075@NODE_3868_length_849_cov_49_663683_g2496_i0_p1_GENE_NODE_3868_length_849_cov_49_663683_g2496_i0NODE_3868_length_849_cov_49_663683_g2496_i0_p1_ORF_typecomplete_len123_score15_16_NODE_3868_length_849_cov_49_663683_g2496_i0418786
MRGRYVAATSSSTGDIDFLLLVLNNEEFGVNLLKFPSEAKFPTNPLRVFVTQANMKPRIMSENFDFARCRVDVEEFCRIVEQVWDAIFGAAYWSLQNTSVFNLQFRVFCEANSKRIMNLFTF